MLNKPKFLSPSINMYGKTVIDLNSATLPFSCIVDGNEAITDFQIIISRLKDNEVVFDTGMQELDKPFFPINNRNQNVVFKIDLKDYFTQITDIKKPIILNTNSVYIENKTYYKYNSETDMYVVYEYNQSNWASDHATLYVEEFVNSTDAYYWTIAFKNSNSNTEIYSAAEVFYANSTPETAIYYSYNGDFTDLSGNLVEDSLKKRKIYFKSTYNQNEGVPLKRYGWRLTDTANNVVVMDTISKNQIYGIADDISCVCSGLVNQTNYQLELYIETQNGYFDVLQSVEFDVNYAVKNIDADFEIEALNNTAGIMLNWSNLRTTEGFVVGDDVSYTENFPVHSSVSIEIPEYTGVVFSNTSSDKKLEIDENSYVVLSFAFDKAQDTTLLEMSGVDEYSNVVTRKLEYTALNRGLKYTVAKGEAVAAYEEQLSETASELCWYIVTLSPLIGGSVNYKLIESVSEGCLFPDEDLYPTSENYTEEERLYPYFGEWNKLRDEVN